MQQRADKTRVAQTEKYTLLNVVENGAYTIEGLSQQVKELKMERDEANRMIGILKDELRIQEDHFNKVSGT